MNKNECKYLQGMECMPLPLGEVPCASCSCNGQRGSSSRSWTLPQAETGRLAGTLRAPCHPLPSSCQKYLLVCILFQTVQSPSCRSIHVIHQCWCRCCREKYTVMGNADMSRQLACSTGAPPMMGVPLPSPTHACHSEEKVIIVCRYVNFGHLRC
jgi:hypothetical protein